jgi:spoIIIJ-associated protein
MSGFFSKLFGGGKKKEETGSKSAGETAAQNLVREVMSGLIEKAHLDLSFDLRSEMGASGEEITVEISGQDDALLTEKEGALLDAFQLFIKRVLQHQLPDQNVNISFDSNGFREESNKELIELAEKLKEKCLEQGRSVYLRALPPKDRKVVHQFLASDDRVRSRSVGDGLFKKIKIYPVKNTNRDAGVDNDMGDSGSENSESV